MITTTGLLELIDNTSWLLLSSLYLVQEHFDENHVPLTLFDRIECLHYLHHTGWGEWEFLEEGFCNGNGQQTFGSIDNF